MIKGIDWFSNFEPGDWVIMIRKFSPMMPGSNKHRISEREGWHHIENVRMKLTKKEFDEVEQRRSSRNNSEAAAAAALNKIHELSARAKKNILRLMIV